MIRNMMHRSQHFSGREMHTKEQPVMGGALSFTSYASSFFEGKARI